MRKECNKYNIIFAVLLTVFVLMCALGFLIVIPEVISKLSYSSTVSKSVAIVGSNTKGTTEIETDVADLPNIEYTRTHIYTYSEDLQEQIINTLINTQAGNFYTSLQVSEDGEYLVLNPCFDYNSILEEIKEHNIKTKADLNAYLQTCTYSDEEESDRYPDNLFKAKKGNCNAYTLLTLVFLNEYFPRYQVDIIQKVVNEEGYAHIYLKIDDEENEPYIFDATQEMYLII